MASKPVVLWAICAALFLGAALRLNALFCPFYSDDYPQLATLHGTFLLRRPVWDLFWFGPRTTSELRRLMDFGFDPWWTASSHKLAMFRPLSSLLIAFDDASFGKNSVLWHVHSFAWWALLIVGAGVLCQQLLPSKVAAVAVLLYALDAAHDAPLCWLANRNTLVSASLGAFALFFHVRYRRDGFRAGLWLSAGAWALSLAGGEYALGMFAYVIAFELLGARDALPRRVLGLAPAMTVLGVYFALRSWLGYGVAGSSLYISPAEPLRYLERAASHVPVLAGDLVLSVPALLWQSGAPLRSALLESGWFTPRVWHALPDWHAVQLAVGLAALLTAWAAWHSLKRRGAQEHAALLWLLGGSLLGLFESASAVPSSRLLAAPALGVSALLAAVLVRGFEPSARPRWLRTSAKLLSAAILLVHGAWAAHSAYANTRRMRERFETSRQAVLGAKLPDSLAARDLVVVSASDYSTDINLPWVRLAHGLPRPRSYRLLSGAAQAHDLVRVDDHAIELTVLANDLHDTFAGSAYRAREDVLHEGDHVELPGLHVQVLRVIDGNPSRMRFRFDHSLDDPALVFLFAYRGGLRPLVLPHVGERLRLPAAGS